MSQSVSCGGDKRECISRSARFSLSISLRARSSTRQWDSISSRTTGSLSHFFNHGPQISSIHFAESVVEEAATPILSDVDAVVCVDAPDEIEMLCCDGFISVVSKRV